MLYVNNVFNYRKTCQIIIYMLLLFLLLFSHHGFQRMTPNQTRFYPNKPTITLHQGPSWSKPGHIVYIQSNRVGTGTPNPPTNITPTNIA